MKTNLKQAKKLRETAAILIKRAEELEAGIDRNKCAHGEYLDTYWGNEECRPCGSPKTVLCKIKADGRTSHPSNKCNPAGCPHFKSLKLLTDN